MELLRVSRIWKRHISTWGKQCANASTVKDIMAPSKKHQSSTNDAILEKITNPQHTCTAQEENMPLKCYKMEAKYRLQQQYSNLYIQ